MIKPLIIALLLGVLLSANSVVYAQSSQIPDWARPPAGTLLPELIQNLCLTKAEVIDVKDEQDGLRSTLKVTHVYCGPNQLLGKTFSAYTPKSGINWNGVYLIPVMHRGENGVFVLRYNPNRLLPGGTLAYTRNGAYGFDFPSREKGNPKFDKARAYAETIEQICKAKPDDQIKLLKKYASSQKQPLGAWAIRSLAAMQPDKMAAFIENLSTKKLPNKSLLAVDDALLNLQKTAWPKSKTRLQLLEKLAKSKLDNVEGNDIIRKLDALMQSGEGEDAQLFDLLKAIVNNSNAVDYPRSAAVELVGKAAEQGWINKNDAVASLLKWIKESTDKDIKLAAARVIANAITLSDEQIAKVRDLKKQFTGDKQIADYLQHAIDRSEQ